MEIQTRRRVALSTMLAPIAWGTTYVTVTEWLPTDRPLFVAATRLLPASIVLLIVGRWQSSWRPHGREWGRTSLLALFNFALFFPLLVVGVYRLPGGIAAAFGGLQPLLIAMLSWAIVGRRPRAAEILTGLAAAAGVSLVVIRPGAEFDLVGIVSVAAATVSFAVGVVLTKRFPATPNRLASTGWQLLIGGVPLAVVALLVEGPPPALSAANVVGFAYLSIVATAVAFVLWFGGIRRLPTAAPPLLGLAAPVTGVVLGWLLLDESLDAMQLLGFAITISAMARGATLPHAVEPPAPPPAETTREAPRLIATSSNARPASSSIPGHFQR